MAYTKTAVLDGPFPDTVKRVKEALRGQGFGILTEIDLQATMREKLDVDIEPYVILGACNLGLAHRALGADRSIGALLPCNVVIRGDGDQIIVDALDPGVMSSLASGLGAVASDAAQLLDAALANVSSEP